MKRSEILSDYNVDEQGIIRSPGKFEGEMLYAPHFYEFANEGEITDTMEDGWGFFASILDVTDDDLREFPELTGITRVGIVEHDNGFVEITPVSREHSAGQT